MDSPGMILKPQQRLKHLGSDSGLQEYQNWDVPTCLWLRWDKVILKPPAFGSQIAKAGIEFQV